MQENMSIRGLVLSKYKSISAFAREIGWGRQKAQRILNGIQEPTLSDIEKMAFLLNIKTAETFTCIFFASLSTKWTA